VKIFSVVHPGVSIEQQGVDLPGVSTAVAAAVVVATVPHFEGSTVAAVAEEEGHFEGSIAAVAYRTEESIVAVVHHFVGTIVVVVRHFVGTIVAAEEDIEKETTAVEVVHQIEGSIAAAAVTSVVAGDTVVHHSGAPIALSAAGVPEAGLDNPIVPVAARVVDPIGSAVVVATAAAAETAVAHQMLVYQEPRRRHLLERCAVVAAQVGQVFAFFLMYDQELPKHRSKDPRQIAFELLVIHMFLQKDREVD
jgi:hypothetical protein